ncbi:hypothetical protein XENOCAPTIV_021882 [Xenoophorus captivus]|uniref:Uncharacterized protein n=1 Tax=Xenoophorus captivus TaxID=1517983 RepID=A0ABV0RIH5_9TELE
MSLTLAVCILICLLISSFIFIKGFPTGELLIKLLLRNSQNYLSPIIFICSDADSFTQSSNSHCLAVPNEVATEKHKISSRFFMEKDEEIRPSIKPPLGDIPTVGPTVCSSSLSAVDCKRARLLQHCSLMFRIPSQSKALIYSHFFS